MATVAAILGLVVGVGVLVLLFRPLFGDKQGFVECVKFWFTPDIISLFTGEYIEDRWSELKLVFWLVCGLLAGAGLYAGLMKLLS